MDLKEEIKKEEKVIEEVIKKSIFSKPWFQSVFGVGLIFLILLVFILWRASTNKIKIDKSLIEAPVINLSPATPGVLDAIYVKVGDRVEPNTLVAKVGEETILSKVAGVISSVNHQEGQIFNPGQPVVSMINLNEEKVIGKIDENKGLSKLKVGQKATFTVDAFGDNKYEGLIEEISPISNESNLAFNISDKREVRQFEVKVRFDTQAHPEFKAGMSAKLTIYLN